MAIRQQNVALRGAGRASIRIGSTSLRFDIRLDPPITHGKVLD
jgi:hypothetical protein